MLHSTDWFIGVPITVTAIDDANEDGGQLCLIEMQTRSSDPLYDAIQANVTVIVRENEREGITYLPQVTRNWPPVPLPPLLEPIMNSDGDWSYTVRWHTALRAVTYVLEEARNEAFSAATQVYSGSATSHTVTERALGRHFYRVKARNSWGDSRWSTPRAVDVVWEVEPNNTPPDEANGPLLSGLVYYGRLPTAWDVNDYYFFDLDKASAVELWLQNIPPGHNYDLILRDLDLVSQPGWYSGEVGDSDEHISIVTMPSGRYLVQVYRRSPDGSPQPYNLQVTYQ